MALVPVLSDGSKVASRMTTGPNGFGIATFEGSDNEHVTEIPDSTLLKYQETRKASHTATKKPSNNTTKKRPAAVLSKTTALDYLIHDFFVAYIDSKLLKSPVIPPT